VRPGELLRRELDARGWTQEYLARHIGRPVPVISEIVRGKKSNTNG